MYSKNLSQPPCQSFATYFWVATHSLENAELESFSSYAKLIIGYIITDCHFN